MKKYGYIAMVILFLGIVVLYDNLSVDIEAPTIYYIFYQFETNDLIGR